MGRHEVCWPSLLELKEGMQKVSRETQLSKEINELVSRGFLLKAMKRIPWRSDRYRKLVFQRPSIQYTLFKLRQQGRIAEEEYQETLKTWKLEKWIEPTSSASKQTRKRP
jgi:hypothetical protein